MALAEAGRFHSSVHHQGINPWYQAEHRRHCPARRGNGKKRRRGIDHLPPSTSSVRPCAPAIPLDATAAAQLTEDGDDAADSEAALGLVTAALEMAQRAEAA
jgi:hypothetical protein